MTTTFKNINDKSFSITFTTSKFADGDPDYSDVVEHSGFKWELEVETLDGHLTVFLNCLGNNSNLWKVGLNTAFTLYKGGEAAYKKAVTSAVNCEENEQGYMDFIKSAELTEYINNGCITIECTAEIKSITGIRQKRQMNFNEKDELSDVELVADNKSFHVSKAVLASFSPVFRAMFCSGFKETNAETVPLEDVNAVEFDMFLQMIHHCHVDINALHVEGLLKLADRFNVDMIVEKCEKFLVDTKDVGVEEKLGLAELYDLSELQNSCLDSIKTMDELKKAITCYEDMGELTAKALLKKSTLLYDEK